MTNVSSINNNCINNHSTCKPLPLLLLLPLPLLLLPLPLLLLLLLPLPPAAAAAAAAAAALRCPPNTHVTHWPRNSRAVSANAFAAACMSSGSAASMNSSGPRAVKSISSAALMETKER